MTHAARHPPAGHPQHHTKPSAAEPKGALWALMVGNFVIGTGVMVVPGTLNDISHSLHVSVPQAGFLITAGAILMGLGAPVLASVVAGWDRRRLLAITLLWYGTLLAACAFAPDYDALLPLRVLAMVSPAVFTPQAAASVGLMVAPARRGKAITFVFLGWSVASVAGMPLGAWIGGTWGWRWAFGGVAVLALLSAIWVWRVMPNGIRPAALSRKAWARALGSTPLMLVVGVTLLSSFGQFTLFAYFAPFYRQVLQADAAQISFLFFWFGGFGLLGNVLLSRHVDRVGAGRAVGWSLAGMALSMALWPLAGQLWLMPLVLLPWALTGFASNSAQQARLSLAAPALAPALMALNTSAIYLGQALGAGGGGALVAASTAAGQAPYERLHWIALAWMLAAMALSHWVSRRIARDPTHV